MDFFKNELSSTLQMFTFPREVVGLRLAAIEVRFPKMAASWNSFMIQEEEKAKEMLPWEFWRNEFSLKGSLFFLISQ